MTEFGAFEPQDVRDFWAHEEHQFTPWLVQEIESAQASDLEDVLGLDLGVLAREKSVGKYNVDIHAEVIEDGRSVVIENQLERFDHDHLGKALAYAAGLDADIIVWIAPRFDDEHRDAIQWLNENSREGIDLFAIRLEVWRIGDSQPALRFNPVEEPSEWKTRVQRKTGDLSETKQLQEAFWTEFRDRIETRKTPLHPRKPKPEYRYANPVGVGWAHLAFGILVDEDRMYVSLTISDDEKAFWQLHESRISIEEELGQELVWEEPQETPAGRWRSQIMVYQDADLSEYEMWDGYHDWLLEIGERFLEVFPDRLNDLHE